MIKSNEEYVREKIEEYLEIFNLPDESEGGGKDPSTTKRVKKRIKLNDDSAAPDHNEGDKKKESPVENADESTNLTADEGEKTIDEDSDEDFIPKAKYQPRIGASGKPRKIPKRQRIITDDELMKHPLINPELDAALLEPLDKDKRHPAQERAIKELTSINERIASLVQVRQMGLSTPENKKQLKQLFKDKRAKITELKRLKMKQRSSHRYRSLKKKIVCIRSCPNSLSRTFPPISRSNVYSRQSLNCIRS